MENLVAGGLHDAAHDVLKEESTEVADVGLGVDCGATAIHANCLALGGLDGLCATGECVMKNDF